jgi:hypothetical protein
MGRAVAPGSFLRVHVQAMQDLHKYDYRIGHIRACANCLIRMRQLYLETSIRQFSSRPIRLASPKHPVFPRFPAYRRLTRHKSCNT